MPEDRAAGIPAVTRGMLVLRWLALSALVIVVDLVTKSWITGNLGYDDRVTLLPFFDLTLRYNEGIAFGFLVTTSSENRWLLPSIAILAMLLITYWIYRDAHDKLHCMALALILGGAGGNAWERIDMGYVTDFFLFHWNGWHFPAFNVADAAITVGAALLILEEILRTRRARPRTPRPPHA